MFFLVAVAEFHLTDHKQNDIRKTAYDRCH